MYYTNPWCKRYLASFIVDHNILTMLISPKCYLHVGIKYKHKKIEKKLQTMANVSYFRLDDDDDDNDNDKIR